MVLAGAAAGTINTIVGSGSLITFPTLLFLGYAPVPANISNNLAMLGGGITGTWGYRRELAGTGPMLRRLAPMSVLGGVTGALLLLWLPAEAFRAIVPVLIAIGLALVVLGPRISAWSTQRHVEAEGREPSWQAPALTGGTYLAGVYGGYFGAAQGVILVGLLSALGRGTLQTLNACKNLLAFLVNLVAGITFAITAWDQIRWEAVALVGLGSLAGGVIGAGVGRRLPSTVLRAFIVVVGVVGIVKLVLFP